MGWKRGRIGDILPKTLNSGAFPVSQHPVGGASIWPASRFPNTSAPSTTPAPARSAQPDPQVRIIMDQITATMPAGHFQPTDQQVLECFARACAVEKKIGQRMLETPHVVTLAERAAYQQSIKAIDLLSSKLQLNPQSRQPRRPGRPRK
jgi:hypothetical protein